MAIRMTVSEGRGKHTRSLGGQDKDPGHGRIPVQTSLYPEGAIPENRSPSGEEAGRMEETF